MDRRGAGDRGYLSFSHLGCKGRLLALPFLPPLSSDACSPLFSTISTLPTAFLHLNMGFPELQLPAASSYRAPGVVTSSLQGGKEAGKGKKKDWWKRLADGRWWVSAWVATGESSGKRHLELLSFQFLSVNFPRRHKSRKSFSFVKKY